MSELVGNPEDQFSSVAGLPLISDQTVGGCALIEQCHGKIDIETNLR